jgi:hypothetical protein
MLAQKGIGALGCQVSQTLGDIFQVSMGPAISWSRKTFNSLAIQVGNQKIFVIMASEYVYLSWFLVSHKLNHRFGLLLLVNTTKLRAY